MDLFNFFVIIKTNKIHTQFRKSNIIFKRVSLRFKVISDL